jgi:hypothetical protein
MSNPQKIGWWPTPQIQTVPMRIETGFEPNIDPDPKAHLILPQNNLS